MPLSEPVAREPLHTRRIVIDGYRRRDGLYDIEAQLTDTKARGFANAYRGFVDAGEPLHGMWMRMTVDNRLQIVACEAASDHTPYAVCAAAAPNFARLAGLRIKPGFLREAAARIGGTAGCTQMGTTAHQTVFSARADREAAAIRAETGVTLTAEELDSRVTAKFGGGSKMVNTCIAYDEAGPVVRQRWPHLAKAVPADQGVSIGPDPNGAKI